MPLSRHSAAIAQESAKCQKRTLAVIEQSRLEGRDQATLLPEAVILLARQQPMPQFGERILIFGFRFGKHHGLERFIIE